MVLRLVGYRPYHLAEVTRELKQFGYSVYLHLAELSARKAAERALGRYAAGGRYPDIKTIADAEDKPTMTYAALRQGNDPDGCEWKNNGADGAEAILVVKPPVCCMLAEGGRYSAANGEWVKDYVESSHLDRWLARCKNCGALLFNEFYEIVSYSGDDDLCFNTVIQAESEQEADWLNTLSPPELSLEMRKRPHFGI